MAKIKNDEQKINKFIQDKLAEMEKLSRADNLTSFNKDGWYNALTGLGTAQDKTNYTTFKYVEYLADVMLAEMWVGDGFGKRIVEVVADDMTREWIEVENDADNFICDEITKLDTETNVNLALKWARLFGGSIVVMGIRDGEKDLTMPVNPKRIKGIDYFKVFDRSETMVTQYMFDMNLLSPNYGKLKIMKVVPRFGTPFDIHIDRCLIFKGDPVPSFMQGVKFYYWGMGALQSIWNQLKDFGSMANSAIKILQEFIIGKYKFKNLAEMLAIGGEDKLRKRINVIELSKSIINGVVLDSEEDYIRDSASVAGLSDLIDRFMMFLSGCSGIPVTRLFGRSASGLNSTGENDIKTYYDMIVAKQKNELKPQLQKLVNYINAYNPKKADNPAVKFNSLFQLSDKEKAELKKLSADTDKIYLDSGVISPEEVRNARFENGWTEEINVETESFLEPEEIEIPRGEKNPKSAMPISTTGIKSNEEFLQINK